MPVKTIEWVDGKVRIIDQTKLPERLVTLDIADVETLGEAIRSLRVRGAPAIGIAGAMGVALAAWHYDGDDAEGLIEQVRAAIDFLKTTRPTAVNLFWALDRMASTLASVEEKGIRAMKESLFGQAMAVLEEDRDVCRRMGRHGADLLPDRATVLTHCNAGGLATADFGTALGVIYAAVEAGKQVRVFADETRPLLQGSRLTAWELKESGVDVTVLCDSAAGSLMQSGVIDCVLVGADRITANGDTANKIGTYPLAVLASKHGIPFYVVAPTSTFDFSIASGDEIPIESRGPEEVVRWSDVPTAPEGVGVYNPAFDTSPHECITAFVTECGVFRPPFHRSLKQLRARSHSFLSCHFCFDDVDWIGFRSRSP